MISRWHLKLTLLRPAFNFKCPLIAVASVINILGPREIAASEINGLIHDFVEAAHRAKEAGFQVVELHMAHGYLLHVFLSPLSNRRTDEIWGALENRMRFPLKQYGRAKK